MWQIIDTYLGIVIMTIGIILFARIIIDEKIKVSRFLLIVSLIISSIIFAIIYFNLNATLKTLVIFLVTAIVYKYLFKIDSKKALFISFLYIVMLIFPDLLSLFFVTNVLNINKVICYEKIAGGLLSNLLVFLFLVGFTYIVRKTLKKIINTRISENVQVIILSMLTLISILLFFYTTIKEFKLNNNVIIYMVAIFVMSLILFILIRQMMVNNKLTKEYDDLLQFMITYEREIENQRILRHEIKNEFRTIRAKICDKQKNKEIIEYIDEIVNDKYEMKKEKYAKFGYLPPNGIKGLFYFKTQEAENKGIKVSINISKKLKNSTIYNLTIKQQRDFGRIIGVFLDNAIEASIETKEKQIGIEVYVSDEGEVKLIISNTYNNQIDKTKLGIESFSTKGNTRGHGLLLVKQLVNKNDVFTIKTNIQNNIYIQTLEIKKIIED